MSNLPAVPSQTDMTKTELNKAEDYARRGMPGVAVVTDALLARMFNLYLEGNTYTQISNILSIDKTVILYFSYKNNWYLTKQEYINELQEKIKGRVIDAKLRNQEFMLLLVQAWQNKIGKKLKTFLATGEGSYLDELDLKEVTQLMKAISMVNEFDSAGRPPAGKAPAVGLNLGNGVIVEKHGDNSVSITPKKESSIGDILQEYADKSREEDRLKFQTKPDIDSNTKGENDENE
jgi:hypothetical protein